MKNYIILAVATLAIILSSCTNTEKVHYAVATTTSTEDTIYYPSFAAKSLDSNDEVVVYINTQDKVIIGDTVAYHAKSNSGVFDKWIYCGKK